MHVLGLIGRPDSPECHDATAALIVDGVLVGALEQERISRRRYAAGEGAEDAVRVLLAEHGLRPSDIDAIGYAWTDATPEISRRVETGLPGGVMATDRLTTAILPGLADQLRHRDIYFFDHHLCHAAETYWLNSEVTADVLVADGMGGAGATSLFRVDDGEFRLLDRYPHAWSLGIFYEAAAYFAGLGWDAAGKLMGLSSYGHPSGRHFLAYDERAGTFSLDPSLRGVPAAGLPEDRLAPAWLEIFERSVFPYAACAGSTFDYATFAADVQVTLEDVGMALARRLRGESGADALLLAGGVALNAHLNRLLARESGYRRVLSTPAPHDGGAAIGAGLLAASLRGEALRPGSVAEPLPIFLGPKVTVADIERALAGTGHRAVSMEPDKLRKEVAAELASGGIVAYFDGPIEIGPRALGARSLLSSVQPRAGLDRLNRIKGRAPWRPAAMALTGGGFRSLGLEPPAHGLSEYMLCVHAVDEAHWAEASAGVHVDGTTRAQYVPDGTGFGNLLSAVAGETGIPAAINTSLNLRGQPMALSPGQAIDLFGEAPDVDMLVLPPYVLRRS
jgi:carbamoyltransferase